MKKYIIILLLFFVSCNLKESEVPIDLSMHLPIIIVEVNNKKARMILDTGGGRTIFHSKALPHYEIYETPLEDVFQGFGGYGTVNLTSQQNIKIGDKTVSAEIYSMDLTNIVKSTGVVGILGIEHIRGANTTIDFMSNKLIVR